MGRDIHAPWLKEGQRIDRLILIKIVDRINYNGHYDYRWLCRCDCGKEVVINEYTLRNKKRVHSCGCYDNSFLTPGDVERATKAGKARAEKRNKDGCNVDMLFREKPISTNTSGVQGVSWEKRLNKWHVYIGYKNNRANLGFYEDLKDAVNIRKKGIEAIKEGTFEEFYETLRGKPYKCKV